MSQGPLLILADAGRPPFATALRQAQIFPLVEAVFADAGYAVAQVEPAAVLADVTSVDPAVFAALARQIAARTPYLPLIAVGPKHSLPENAIPFAPFVGNFDRLAARLRASLRVRAAHTTVLRRLATAGHSAGSHLDFDPGRDATVLLIGRGRAYPALSVALGARMGVVGAFRVEVAGRHLNTREINGIVLGEGFTARVVDAFLAVLSEDARFRNLPIVLTSDGLAPNFELPNLEIIRGEPQHVAANALPLIRQHAFDQQLGRTLRAIEANGLLDPRTGLLTPAAFHRDLTKAVHDMQCDGGGLSVARFVFDVQNPRAQLDGARVISRLMRKTDFATAQPDCSVIVLFSGTDLRAAHGIARRLSAVMRHTADGHGNRRASPAISIATLLPTDTEKSLLARLYELRQEAI